MLHHHYILNIRDLLHCDSISSTTLNGHEKDDKDTQKEHSQMKYLKVFLQLQIKKNLLHIFWWDVGMAAVVYRFWIAQLYSLSWCKGR